MPRAPPTDRPKRTTRSSTSAAAAAAATLSIPLNTTTAPSDSPPFLLPSLSTATSASPSLPATSSDNAPLLATSLESPNENHNSIVNTLRGGQRRAAIAHPVESSPPKRNRVSDLSSQPTQSATSGTSQETAPQAITSISMKTSSLLSASEASAPTAESAEPTSNNIFDRPITQVTTSGGTSYNDPNANGPLSPDPISTSPGASQAPPDSVLESLATAATEDNSGSSSLAITNAAPATTTTTGAAASRRLFKKRSQTPQQKQTRRQQQKGLPQETSQSSGDVESADSFSPLSSPSTITNPSTPSNKGKRRRDDSEDKDNQGEAVPIQSEEQQELEDGSGAASKDGHQEPLPSSSSSPTPLLTTAVPIKSRKSRGPAKAQSSKKATTRRSVAPTPGSSSATISQKQPLNRKQRARITGPEAAETDALVGTLPLTKTRKNAAKAPKAALTGTTTFQPKKKRRVEPSLALPEAGHRSSSSLNIRAQKPLSSRRPRRCPSTIEDSGSECEGKDPQKQHQPQEEDCDSEVEDEELEEHQGHYYTTRRQPTLKNDNWGVWSRLAMDICFNCQIPKLKNSSGIHSNDWAPDDIAAAVQLMMFSSNQLWTGQVGYDVGFWTGFWAGHPCNCFDRWTVRHGQESLQKHTYIPPGQFTPFSPGNTHPEVPHFSSYSYCPGRLPREYTFSGSHPSHAGPSAHRHAFPGDRVPFASFSHYPEPPRSAPIGPSATESASSAWQTLPPCIETAGQSSGHLTQLPKMASVFSPSVPPAIVEGPSSMSAQVPACPAAHSASVSDSVAPLMGQSSAEVGLGETHSEGREALRVSISCVDRI